MPETLPKADHYPFVLPVAHNDPDPRRGDARRGMDWDDLQQVPVVPVKARHDGWTAERQRDFLVALADTACVSDACALVGLTPRSAYRLRQRPEAAAFDRAWAQALRVGSQRLGNLAIERASYGAPRLMRVGNQLREVRVPDPRLLMYLLTTLDRQGLGPFSAEGDAAREQARTRMDAELAQLVDSESPAELLLSMDGDGRPDCER